MNTREYKEKLFAEIKELHGQLSSDDWAEYYNEKCNKMLSFLEEQNEKAGIFEKACNKEVHQHFWEVLVGNTLLEAGYNPQRDNRNGAPDYFFEKDGIKFHIEAKAPTAGDNEDLRQKPIPMINADGDEVNNSFEVGVMDGTNTILRFTNVLDSVVKQINSSFYTLGRVSKDDKIIVAINGSEASMGIEINDEDFSAGCLAYGKNMYCALYGLDGNEYFSYKHKRFLQNVAPIMKRGISISNRYFCPENDTPIDGVIYSNVDIKNYFSYGSPFLFYPNPNKEDISNYFPFCRKMTPPRILTSNK